MAATITVKSTRDDNRVALWERDDAHPGGEAMVYGPDPVEVGDTPLVRLRIGERALEEVREPRKASAKE